MNYTLIQLKSLGHMYLDDYANLDNRRSGKYARQHAYKKLAFRLNKKSVHFADMKNEREVEEAINKLKSMIARRKKKIKNLQSGKAQYIYGRIRKVKAPVVEKKWWEKLLSWFNFK